MIWLGTPQANAGGGGGGLWSGGDGSMSVNEMLTWKRDQMIYI